MAALELTAKGSPLQPEDGSNLRLKMALLQDAGGVKGRAWATFVPTGEFTETGRPAGVSGAKTTSFVSTDPKLVPLLDQAMISKLLIVNNLECLFCF